MAVYTDGTHVVATTLDELHEAARQIGLKRHRFHNRRGREHPHYDLKTQEEFDQALKVGVVVTNPRKIATVAKEAWRREQAP